MKVALHACCGPCASACVPRLKADGHEVTLLFANSNIDTAEEFERRRAAAETLARADGVPFATLPYDHESWLREVADGLEDEPERGRRCERCFRFSLAQAAAFAAERGLDAFATSLTVSPHKPSALVFAAGDEVCEAGRARRPRRAEDGVCEAGRARRLRRADDKPGVPRFLHDDFKKRDGFLLSVRRTDELGLYRQTYCGCEFSRRKETRT